MRHAVWWMTLCWLTAALTGAALGAGEPEPGGRQRPPGEASNPEAESPPAAAGKNEQAETVQDPEAAELEAIADYQVLQAPFERSRQGDSAQIFNPFEARKPRTLHGSTYEYHRNDNLDARNFFDPLGQPLPEFKRNQFGLQLGAELGTRLSLFGSYDGLRIVRGSTRVSRVPSLAQRGGDFSELGLTLIDPLTRRPFPHNQIPQDRIHPVARRVLEVFPEPNRSEPERNFVNNQPNVDNVDTLLFRADFQLDDSTKVLGRYGYSDQSEIDARALPIFNVIQAESEHEFDVSVNHNFSDRFTSQFGLSVFRNDESEVSPNAGRAGLLDSLGIAGVSVQDPLDEGYPDFFIDGYARFGDDESPSTSVRNRLILEGNLQYVHGDHRLGFAYNVMWLQLNNFRTGEDRRGVFSFGGNFTGEPLGDFLLGLPDQAERAAGSDRVDMRTAQFEFSAFDDWRISPQLNLNLGLSYSYYQPYRSLHPVASFFPLLVEPEGPGEVVISGTDRAEELGFGASEGRLVLPDRNDWSPRVGLAYSPFGNNRTVLRASYSIFYVPLQEWQAVDFMGRNYPFYRRETAVSSSLTPQLDLSNPFEDAAPPEIIIRGIEPNKRTPYVQFWGLVLQKRLFEQWQFDVGYSGSKGTRLSRLIPGNVPEPAPGSIQDRRPIPAFGSFSIVSGGASWSEHQLNFDLERQLADRFALRAGLDWRREISDLVFWRVADPRNLAAERAIEDFPELTAFFNYIVDLPFGNTRSEAGAGLWRRLVSGWRLSGITRFRSGRPFTVNLAADVNNDGLSNDRPNRLGPGLLDGNERSIDEWFNVDDFAQPQAFTFGDSGRNILRGPAFQTWDISLSKRTSLADGHFLEFRIEFFNAFNHVNFDEPETTLGTSSFGQIFGAEDAREIEIALKYSF